MTRATSFTELYSVTGAVLQSSTGRSWWQERGMQGRPSQPFATLLFETIETIENAIVETAQLLQPNMETGEYFVQVPASIGKMDCIAKFYRDGDNNSALDAATRFLGALRLEARFDDMWQIMGLVGPAKLTDQSAIFRDTNENRAEVRWQIYAIIADPLPLTGTKVSEINTQVVNVVHNSLDGTETQVAVEIENTTDESS